MGRGRPRKKENRRITGAWKVSIQKRKEGLETAKEKLNERKNQSNKGDGSEYNTKERPRELGKKGPRGKS